jgi:flagellar biosynthesis component FlhA
MNEDLELFKSQEIEFCEELIHQSHCLEKQAHCLTTDLGEIIDILERLLRESIRLRDIKKNIIRD